MTRESREKLNISKKKEKELEWAWDKLLKLINDHKEAKKKGEPYDPRLAVINPDDLKKEEDGEIFGKFKKGIWQKAEFEVYTNKVSKDLEKKDNNSRDNLRDWLGAKAQIQFVKEESEEERKRQ